MGQKKVLVKTQTYEKFDQIDGSHPLKEVVPKGYIDYPARLRAGGKLTYFNFSLAKDMGLLSLDHPEQMNSVLEEKILETFSIQIINEYDEMNNRKFPEDQLKSGTYMATRYLQLQHDDKKGRTSGDGRSVWNGQVKNNGRTWDISSGGTGATRLSPATSKFNKFFETGDPSISYGCGYAELDEGIATALMSKIFKSNHVRTEETLAIIDFGNNISINVRAYQNLLRPSHFFMFLKQDDLKSLKALTNYYIDSQRERDEWTECPKGTKRYDFFLDQIVNRFARLAANFEDEYIFCWLDWDGDNILMDGGIIDYGSVRQFGLCHYEYRYDDVERYSTNLLEQKQKAKYTVQTFIQLVNFIKNKEKTPIADFTTHPALVRFEEVFEQQKNLNLLHKMGLTERKANQILKREKDLIENFRKAFTYFERTKSHQGMIEIPDGITCDAVFSMRDLLREYPQVLMVANEHLSDEEFMDLMRTSLATEEDMEINSYRKQKIRDFQSSYSEIVEKVAKLFQDSISDTLQQMATRTNIINKSARITGDAVTSIVDKIMTRKKKYSSDELYELFYELSKIQNLDPDKTINFLNKKPTSTLLQMLDIIEELREGI